MNYPPRGAGHAPSGRRPGTTALGVIIAFNLLSTSVHYAHNFVEANAYPPVFLFVNATAYKVGIVVFWPLLTAFGLWGYKLYADGHTRWPQVMLAAYAVLGLSTPGHFLSGNPDIAPFFYATLFTDFVAGSALLAFVVWTVGRSDR
jgi:hypothetical protein